MLRHALDSEIIMCDVRPLPTDREPIHPGEVLRHEFRLPLKRTQAELADALKIDRPAYSAIENGRRSITPRLAMRLERVLGTPAIMWLSMQTDVDLYRARNESGRIELRTLRPLTEAKPTEPASATSRETAARRRRKF